MIGASGDGWASMAALAKAALVPAKATLTLRGPIHLMCWLLASQKVIERVRDSCCSRNKVALKVYHAHKLLRRPYGRNGQLFSLKGQIRF